MLSQMSQRKMGSVYHFCVEPKKAKPIKRQSKMVVTVDRLVDKIDGVLRVQTCNKK